MGKIHKIVNIALIFMLIGAFVCQDTTYALRVPISTKIDSDRVKLTCIYLSSSKTARKTIDAFEPRRETIGGKNALDEILERLVEKIGFNVVPGAVRIGIDEVWGKFIGANKKWVNKGNKLIAKDIRKQGKVSKKTLDELKRIIGEEFKFPLELKEYIESKTSHIKGQVVVRSSGRTEDSFIRNLAGIFISPKKRSEIFITQAVRELFYHAMKKIWIEQNALEYPVDGVPNKLSREDGFGILIEPFLDFDASGTAVSDYCGHTCIETVIGDIETAVKPAYANSTHFRFKKGANEFEHITPFLEMPYEFKLKGTKYCAEINKVALWEKMEQYPKINGKFSPITEEQAIEVNRVVNELEKELGFPIDVEWGYMDGKLYIVQVRPVINYKKEELVKISQELKTKKAFTETPIARGHTDSQGFTGRVVLFDKGVSEKAIRQFEEGFGGPYIRVQDDVALKVSDNPTNAKVLVDVNQGAFDAHGIDAITNRIDKDFVYTNGPILKEGFERSLKFIPRPALEDVWISQEEVTYFSNGLKGSFYLVDKGASLETEYTNRQKTLREFYNRFNEMLEPHTVLDPAEEINKLCDIVVGTFFSEGAENIKEINKVIYEIIRSCYYGGSNDSALYSATKAIMDNLNYSVLKEEDIEFIQSKMPLLKEALSYPLYPNAWENYYIMTSRSLLVLDGIEKTITEAKVKEKKEASAKEEAFENEYLEGRKTLPDKYRVVLINARDLDCDFNSEFFKKSLGIDECIDMHTRDVDEIKAVLKNVDYDVSYFHVHLHGINIPGLTKELEKICKKNPDVDIAIDPGGIASARDFEAFIQQYGDIFIAGFATPFEGEILKDIISKQKRWGRIKKKIEVQRQKAGYQEKFRVLVCDDDATIKISIEVGWREYLPKQEFEFDYAADGTEARKKLAGSRYNLVLYDMMMPGFDEEFQKALILRADSRVAWTGFARVEFRSSVIPPLYTQSDYINKPYPIDKLCGLIENLRQKQTNLAERKKLMQEQKLGTKNIFIINDDAVEGMRLANCIDRNFKDRFSIVSVGSVQELEEQPDLPFPDFIITDSHDITGILKEKGLYPGGLIFTSDEAARFSIEDFDPQFNVLGVIEKPFYIQDILKIIQTKVTSLIQNKAKEKKILMIEIAMAVRNYREENGKYPYIRNSEVFPDSIKDKMKKLKIRLYYESDDSVWIYSEVDDRYVRLSKMSKYSFSSKHTEAEILTRKEIEKIERTGAAVRVFKGGHDVGGIFKFATDLMFINSDFGGITATLEEDKNTRHLSQEFSKLHSEIVGGNADILERIVNMAGQLSKEGTLTVDEAEGYINELKNILENLKKQKEDVRKISKEALNLYKGEYDLSSDFEELFADINGAIEKVQSRVEIATGITDSYSSQSVSDIIKSICSDSSVVKVEDNLPKGIFVNGNRLTLTNAFVNIITNAVYFAKEEHKEGAEVKVILTKQEDKIKIDIIDKGKGISKKLLKINPITEKPVLFTLNTSQRKGGTGLGTTDAWYAVKDHNGTIDVQSESGKGTTFTITLPLDSGETTDRTFMGYLKQEFSYYLNNQKPMNILDIGGNPSVGLALFGRRDGSVFSSRLKNLLDDNNIKSKIYCISPGVENSEHDNITLMRGLYQHLLDKPLEKGKYHIITINAPDFIYDLEGFLGALDYLLADDGVVIFRPDENRSGFKQTVNQLIETDYSNIFTTEYLRYGNMQDLPEGDWPLLAPLLIRRAATIQNLNNIKTFVTKPTDL